MRIYSLALLILVCASSFAAKGSNGQNSAGGKVRPASQVYRRYCISCHGPDGKAQTSKGKFSHARDLSDVEWQGQVTDERIFNSIMNGRNVRGNMPAFANKLNEKEVNALVEFVRRLKSLGRQS